MSHDIVHTIEIKVNPALMKHEDEIKEVVSKLFGAFKLDRGAMFDDIVRTTEEIKLDNIPITPSEVNWCCIWNNPKDLHTRVMIVATIDDKWAFVEFVPRPNEYKHPAIFRLQDLNI